LFTNRPVTSQLFQHDIPNLTATFDLRRRSECTDHIDPQRSDPLLQRPFEYSDPDFMSMFSCPVYRTGWVAPPDDGFFEQVRFVGGMGDQLFGGCRHSVVCIYLIIKD